MLMVDRYTDYRYNGQGRKFSQMKVHQQLCRLAFVKTLAERLQQVVSEGLVKSGRAWAMSAGIGQSTLSELMLGKTTNPEHKTMVALADAAGVSVQWLAHGVGSMDAEPADFADDPYPSRAPVLAALKLHGDTEALRRLLAVEYTEDPGFPVWMRKASELCEDVEREKSSSRVRRNGRSKQ